MELKLGETLLTDLPDNTVEEILELLIGPGGISVSCETQQNYTRNDPRIYTKRVEITLWKSFEIDIKG